MSIEPRFLYIKVKIARPIATSAAATVKIKNTNINILNGGYNNKSESPTVFLIHGAGMNATVWQMQTRYLASKGINVLAIDLPGHGSSEGNGLETIEDMALWVIELINELKITHAIIAVSYTHLTLPTILLV